MPWHHFNSPLQKWVAQPSFLVGELLFYALTILTLIHAVRRRRLLVWVGALVAGTANDVFFMVLPVVDNFWQAQATIMLTARMPLYIPCVYICFMYIPTVAVERLGLPRLARAAATGLLAALFYAPYDLVGAKFLWWTWHDTDRPIVNRLLGAPIGSTMWVITFVAVFAFWCARKGRAATTLLLVATTSSMLMIVQMTVLQQLDGGVPGPRGLLVVTGLYATIIALAWRRRAPEPLEPAATGDATRWSERALHAGTIVYFAVLLTIAACFDPAMHRSLSVHQTYGPCHVEAKDITGALRYEFVCAADYDEDYTFCDAPLPADGTRWYEVCGKPYVSRTRFLLVLAALGLAGLFAFTSLLLRRA